MRYRSASIGSSSFIRNKQLASEDGSSGMDIANNGGGRKDHYTIGEVVARLRKEFPTLSVSKVRYLERRRLINLKRTRGGYRLFSPKDVELLRYILTLQAKE